MSEFSPGRRRPSYFGSLILRMIGHPFVQKLVHGLFYLTCLNLFCSLFVWGGYDFSVGPFHLSARFLWQAFLSCLVVGVIRSWIVATQSATPMAEWIRSPLLLFFFAGFLYSVNDRVIVTGDTTSTIYLPFSILREFDLDLDEFPFLIENEFPYYVTRNDGHLVSTYPPWPSFLAVPVYLFPALHGFVPGATMGIHELEKRSALLITALSVLVLLFALRRFTQERVAWWVTMIYAFGTSNLTISSQALWTQGPSQLFLALALYYLIRGMEQAKFTVYAGLALSGAVLCRPLNVLVALPIAAYVLHERRDYFPGFVLAASPLALLYMMYNTFYFGSPFTLGFAGTVVSPVSLIGRHMSWFQTPLLEGLTGVLFSPARGLFFYSPILLFSLVGMMMIWKEGGSPLLRYLSVTFFLCVIPVATVGHWWGGWVYGSRLLADTTPILCLFLCRPFERYRQRVALKWTLICLAAFSIGMHLVGAYSSYLASIDFDSYPELVWSWEFSPPGYYGRKILNAILAVFRD